MKTPVERLIEAVEKGYNQNPALWEEWKKVMVSAEKEMVAEAISKGIPVDEYFEFHHLCK